MPYSATDYWETLLRRDDLSAVGQSALPAALNEWLYRTLARNLAAFLRRQGLDRPLPASVFDVGVGTGYWVAWWRDRGVGLVDGCDLVPDAVERVNDRLGTEHGRMVVADIADPSGLGVDRYPLVTVMNVLLHVTEDAAFERALTNVAALVAPGGRLLLTEPILLHDGYERAYDPEKHSRARSLAAYREPLAASGLVLERVAGATAIANNPIEAGSPAAYRRFASWWRFVARRSKEDPGSAAWIGRAIYHLDPMVLRGGTAPSSKFAVFRRS